MTRLLREPFFSLQCLDLPDYPLHQRDAGEGCDQIVAVDQILHVLCAFGCNLNREGFGLGAVLAFIGPDDLCTLPKMGL